MIEVGKEEQEEEENIKKNKKKKKIFFFRLLKFKLLPKTSFTSAAVTYSL